MEGPTSTSANEPSRPIRRPTAKGCNNRGCQSKSARVFPVSFLDGKFELCASCRNRLGDKSSCSRFRCPTPSLCNDKKRMMVCSNGECQRCTHVACEKPEIASKAMANSSYLYFCFDCRTNRVRYKLLQNSARSKINKEEVRRVLPLPKR